MFTDPNRKGDLAEQWVALLAAWKGAEVHRNTNCTGSTDMILKFNGKLYEIDVKLARSNGYWYGNTNTVEAPVIPVLVIPDGDITNWKVKWIRNRFPPELEGFWDKPIHSTLNGHQIKD
jgi:hypothetical protein